MWYDPMMAWLLCSPLHGILSESFMLISVRGRKSGRIIRTPVNYVREGNRLWVTNQRNRTWWRNLRGGAPVNVFVQGKERKGLGDAMVDQRSVATGVATFLRLKPQYAKYYHVGLDAMGHPVAADCERAALERVAIRITKGSSRILVHQHDYTAYHVPSETAANALFKARLRSALDVDALVDSAPVEQCAP